MLSIAILSLIGIIYDFISDLEIFRARIFLSSIMVISWWTICFPLALILLCISILWLIVCLIGNHKNS